MTWCHVDARWTTGGTLEKHGEKYGGVFGKACRTSAMFFDLGNNTLSNTATKLSYSEIGAAARDFMCSAAQS